MNPDPYDTGTPKYQTADSIYEDLCAVASGEEIGILGEIFADVSYEGQDYYYTDKGGELKEKYETLSEYDSKMWLMELAVFQVDEDAEIHDIVYTSLCNEDMARRLKFKPLFIEHMLRGDKSAYDEVSEAFYYEVQEQELNRFEYWAMSACERHFTINPYGNFCSALYSKAKGLRLEKETRLIAECRAFLNSYDDFILGMRMNQRLFEEQEQRYDAKVSALESAYAEKVKLLYSIAEQRGLSLDTIEAKLLP